jgi:hypothetical protein
LFKYHSERKWAEKIPRGWNAFSLASILSKFGDGSVRGDQYEGTSVYKPNRGLAVNNLTQASTSTIPYGFESSAKVQEIFVFCLSASVNPELWKRFAAVACVKITNIPTFCQRVMAALPESAKYIRGGQRIGGRVTYYNETDNCTPRWALPDEIATSKLRQFAW